MSPIPDSVLPRERELDPDFARTERIIIASNRCTRAYIELAEVREKHARGEASDDDLAVAQRKADTLWAVLEEVAK
jgi:hypothetical protein